MPRPAGHPDNSLISRLGNEMRWAAVNDRQAATAPGRAAFNDRFEREARERFGDDLSPDDLAYRAERLRKAYFLRLALKSAQARRVRTQAEQVEQAVEAELAELTDQTIRPSDPKAEAAAR